MDTHAQPIAPTKSNFVTVLAWIFIVLSGFATFIGIAQNIMIQSMFADPKFNEAFSKAPPEVPASATFMASNLRLLFACILGVFVVTLISSIGLLNRRNWARLIFIAIMVLGILWNVGGMLFQFVMFSSFPTPPQAPHESDSFQSMFITMMVFSAGVVIAISVLYGWIIKRLISKPVAAEFGK